jgi:hypothetical protein
VLIFQFKDFIKTNTKVTLGKIIQNEISFLDSNSEEEVVNNFFTDIGDFYEKSLDMPYTTIFGYLTVIVFFLLVMR